jgi:outer membrane protein assembly factor BamB
MKKLRLWPGVAFVALICLFWYVVPMFIPEALMLGLGVVLLGTAGFLVWWLFFSRAPVGERWIALGIMALAMFLTSRLLDVSIATANMGLMFYIYCVPALLLAFMLWVFLTRNLQGRMKWLSMTLTIMVATGFWVFLRTDGMRGEGNHDLNWRWAKTSEENLLENQQSGRELNTTAVLPGKPAEWPGFRGAGRDGVVSGLTIKTDWQSDPPKMLWKKPVGPGCSSFAVHGNLVFTQEQRGEEEAVSCYDLENGDEVWIHTDKARFYDSHAGAGPRSTPVLHGSKIYTLGGTGILNCLDQATGKAFWTCNAAQLTKVKTLTWGFAGSPLIAGNAVIVSTAGKLAAFDTANGQLLWQGPDGGSSYSSPQFLTMGRVQQVLFMSAAGALSVDPASGKTLWEYSSKAEDRILQPALIDSGCILMASDYKGLRKLSVKNEGGKFKLKEEWFSPDLSVYFNDHVISKGFVYTYDGPSLCCVDLKDGKRIWKGDRYRGWNLLLKDQDLLLILTEKGELALVNADSKKFSELARIPAIKGRTWNHPAMAGNIILVRNASEMAAFRLPQ